MMQNIVIGQFRGRKLQIKYYLPLAIVAAYFMAIFAGSFLHPYSWALKFNTTPSVKRGLYLEFDRLSSTKTQLQRGQYVLFSIPDSFKTMVYSRHYMPEDAPLIKQVGAVPGDKFCVYDTYFTINDVKIGPVVDKDTIGRPLPKLRGCSIVDAGYFVPVGTNIPNSFDGRYMGQVPVSLIDGKAKPLWTF